MNKMNLFLVEFGQPTIVSTYNFGGFSGPKPLYIIADDYAAASDKANRYLQNYNETNPETNSILDGDGSLRPQTEKHEPLQVVSVRLLSNEVIY